MIAIGGDGQWSGGVMADSNRLTHIADDGSAKMVDVWGKPDSDRKAVAVGEITLSPTTIELINSSGIAKGNVLATARIAGIQAAKKTAELIPLCHTLSLSSVDLDIVMKKDQAS